MFKNIQKVKFLFFSSLFALSILKCAYAEGGGCGKHHHRKPRSNSCETSIPIKKVPCVIKRSGKYYISKDLVYEGSDKAINVKASGVTINFGGHDLLLNSLSATGIYAKDVQELTIINDKIYNSIPSLRQGQYCNPSC